MSVLTTLDFLVDRPLYQREKPFAIYPPLDGKWTADDPDLRNIQWEQRQVEVHDIRKLGDTGLDTSGFEVVYHKSNQFQVVAPSTLPAYAEETQAFLKQHFKAASVICFDYTLRKNVDLHRPEWDSSDKAMIQGPPTGAHSGTLPHKPCRSLTNSSLEDCSLEWAGELLRQHLGEAELQRLTADNYRFRIVNTWRPLIPKIEDRPLAYCDYRSMDMSDCLAVDIVYPNRTQELYYIRHNAEQRWYWLPEQTPADLLLMKMYDSAIEAEAKFCPHVSFPNPECPVSAPPRESVETRCIVVTHS